MLNKMIGVMGVGGVRRSVGSWDQDPVVVPVVAN